VHDTRQVTHRTPEVALRPGAGTTPRRPSETTTAVADNFESSHARTLITIAAGAYIVSRGLSKIGRGDGHLGND
jgi:hypothetical protein